MSIHDLNESYAGKGAKMLRGFDGFDNYFLLGTFPEFGAQLALRARNTSAGANGTRVGFKLRLMPLPGAELGSWASACPSISWAGYTLDSNERRSQCFGIGLAAWTRAEVAQAIKDVDYAQVLDNWLTALGLTWDAKQRELLPAYLAEAEDALFKDDFGEGVAPIDVEGRVAHAARSIQYESQIWLSEEYQESADAGDAGGLFDGGDDDPDDEEENGDDPFA